jgi:hypothetical protein
VLPTGTTLRGEWVAQSDGPLSGFDRISFVFTLASAPAAHLADEAPVECPVVDGLLTPLPGHLCLDVTESGGVGTAPTAQVFNSSRVGADISANNAGSEFGWFVGGNWAVTAP